MLRPATTSDTSSIEALLHAIPGFWHAEWRPDAVARALASSNGLAYVWEEAGQIQGFVCAQDTGFLGYLSLLAVAPGAQGRGIGRELVRQVEAELALKGCAVLITDAWKDAEGFYRALGWTPPGVVLLRKRLIPGEGGVK